MTIWAFERGRDFCGGFLTRCESRGEKEVLVVQECKRKDGSSLNRHLKRFLGGASREVER
jgi:hypothetical protein